MIPSIGTEMNRLIFSGARTPTLLGKSSPKRMTLATVTKAIRKDQPGLTSGPASDVVNTLAQAKKVILIARLHSKMHVKRCDALLSRSAMARSDLREESSFKRWADVRENKAASLAEKSAERKSIPIKASGTNSHANELMGVMAGSNGNFGFLYSAPARCHSSSAVLDLPKAKSNSLNAGTIIAAVANAYESETTLKTANS